MSTIREQYLRAWRELVAVAEAVPSASWDDLTPCEEWSARRLAAHTADAARQSRAVLRGRPPLTPITELAGDNPAAALRAEAAALTATAAELDPAATINTPHGALPIEQVLAMALVEPVVHAWDLAAATGQSLHFDDEAVATLMLGVDQLGDQLATTGMYATALPMPPSAEPARRLLAALGRRA